MLGRLRRAAVAAVALGAALAPSAHGALVPSRAEVPGFAPAGSGAATARSALAGQVPAALRRAPAQGAAYRAGARRVAFGAFTLRSARSAAAAARAAGRGGRTVRIAAAAGRLRVRATRRATDAVLVLRVSRAVGAVRVRLAGRQAAAAALLARSYAETLAARMAADLARTPWERNLEGIRPDGAVPKQVALRAFAMVYGSLPGARRPAGPAGFDGRAGTAAIGMVAGVWDQLSKAQQAAIDRKLGARHDPSSPPLAHRAEPNLTLAPQYQPLANKYVPIYKAKIPSAPLPVPKVFKADAEIPTSFGGDAFMDALPLSDGGFWGFGAPSYCRIRVPPSAQKDFGKPFFELAMAHEVFHCFQFVIAPGWPSVANWIKEGTADWAAVTVHPVPASVGAGPYKQYLKESPKDLFARVYDGTGFWGHVDEAFGPGSLWAKIPAVLNAPDSVGAFLLAGGGDLTSIETWASAMWRNAGAGPAWNQTKPFAISFGAFPLGSFKISGSSAIDGAKYATIPYTILKDAKQNLVLLQRTTGYLRAGTSTKDYGMIDGEWFCFGTCKCPKGYESSIPEHKKIAGDKLLIGLASSGIEGLGSVQYRDPKDFCSKKKPPKGPAESNGDPHMTSLDGLHYDFQAAGEFVLVRSRSGDLEIQARQEPYEKSTRVTVNTMLGMRVGGRRVTVAPGPTTDSPPAVRIDGAPNALPAGTVVALGGGSVARQSGEDGWVDVVWPDGSEIVVRPVGRWGVAARIELADGRADAVNGLLGDFDGNPRNDLASRGGKRIAYTARASSGWGAVDRYRIPEEFTKKFFADLYDVVGDSWRITQPASLLDYGPGQTTKTFTDRDIPERPLDPDEVARAKRAKAERICRAAGVTLPGPLADCITDVAATGNAAFAEDAAISQQAAQASWSRLRAGADRNTILNLLPTADGGLRLAFQDRLPGPAYRMASVALDANGREGPAEIIEAVDSEPALLTGPDGTIQALTPQIPLDGRPSGIYRYVRTPGGTWSRDPVPVTTRGYSYAGRPNGLYAGATLLTAAPMAGIGQIFRGSGDPNPGTPIPAPDGCYSTSPTLAIDGATGAVWAAWIQALCGANGGIYAQQVDPATGGLVGAPLKAPGSTWKIDGRDGAADLSLVEDLAVTGRPGQPGVFVAFAADNGARVRVWRVGAPGTTAVGRRSSRFDARDAMLTAEPRSGRMWLAWTENNRLWLQRIAASGVLLGSPRPLDPPRDAKTPVLAVHTWDTVAAENAVDVVYGYRRDGDTPGGLWHTRITP